MAESDIRSLVDSINKHKNFKRLAAYSIQSLCKKCSPPSNGWQESARSSFEAGAAEAISGVLVKNASDAEIFMLCLTQLQAIAASGIGSGLIKCGAVSSCLGAFQEYCRGVKVPTATECVSGGHILPSGGYASSGPDADTVNILESFLRFLGLVANNDRADVIAAAAPAIDAVVHLLPVLPTPRAAKLALQFLEQISRAEMTVAALITEQALQSVTTLLDDSFFGAVASDKKKSARPSPSPTANNASNFGAFAKFTMHLDSGFKLLDRLSKQEAGLAALRECKSIAQLASSAEFAQAACDKATGALAIKVLARVLGNDISALIGRVEGAASGSCSLKEGEFAASILASLTLDSEIAARMISNNLHLAVLKLLTLNSHRCISAKAAAHVVRSMQRLGRYNSDACTAYQENDAISKIMCVMRKNDQFVDLVAAGLDTLADLLTTAEDLEEALKAVDGPAFAQEAKSGVAFALLMLQSAGLTDTNVAFAACRFLFAAVACGYDTEELRKNRLVASVMAVARKHRRSTDIQVFVSLLLHSTASGKDAVTEILNNGVVELAIENLRGEAQAAPAELGTAAPAAVSDAGGLTTGDDILAAATLRLLHSLCISEDVIVSMKTAGVIRAMVSAYARHNNSDLVFESFSELVDAIINESDVVKAVETVVHSTTEIKLLTGDPVLFSIVEQELDADMKEAEARFAASKPSTTSSTVHATTENLTESLCLLEAISTSARLAAALLTVNGIEAVTRAMAIVSVIKGVASSNTGKSGGRFMDEKLQEEALMRAANTLTGLCRLNADWPVGVPGLDPIPTSALPSAGLMSTTSFRGFLRSLSGMVSAPQEVRDKLLLRAGYSSFGGHRRRRSGKTPDEEFRKIREKIGNAIFRTVVMKTLVRSINTKSHMSSQVASACIAIGVFSLGKIGAKTSPLEICISQSAVEALSSAIRSASTFPVVVIAAANALGCIAMAERTIDEASGLLKPAGKPELHGTAAVSARGGTRQIIRDLQSANSQGGARWHAPSGQSEIGAFLRVLLTVADTQKGAELLRKQGALEVLIATLDVAHEEEGAPTAPSAAVAVKDSAETQDAGSTAPPVDAFAQFDMSNDGVFGQPDAMSHSQETVFLVIAILSKLMDAKDLLDAVKIILVTAERIKHHTIKSASLALCTVALTTVLALTESANCKAAGAGVWKQALDGCVVLLSAIVDVTLDSDAAPNPLLPQIIQTLLPLCSRCVHAMVVHMEQLRGEQPEEEWSATIGGATVQTCSALRIGLSSAKSSVPERITAALLGSAEELLDSLHGLLHYNAGLSVCAGPIDCRGTSDHASAIVCRLARQLSTGRNIAALANCFKVLIKLGTSEICASSFASVGKEVGSILAELLPSLLDNHALTAETFGLALQLVGTIAHSSPEYSQQLRKMGTAAMINMAVQRFCDNAAMLDDNVISEDEQHEMRHQIAPLVLGSCVALESIHGFTVEENDNAGDLPLACKVLEILMDDPTDILHEDVGILTEMCNLITTLCTSTEGSENVENCKKVPKKEADGARENFLELDGKEFVISALSHPSGDAKLLKAGARALEALGGANNGLVFELRRVVMSIRELLELPADSALCLPDAVPEAKAAQPRTIAEQLRQLTAALRNLAAGVTGAAGLTPSVYRFLYDSLLAAGKLLTEIPSALKSERGESLMAAASAAGVVSPAKSYRSKRSAGSSDGHDRTLSRSSRAASILSPALSSRSKRSASALFSPKSSSGIDSAVDEVVGGPYTFAQAMEECQSSYVSVYQSLSRLFECGLVQNRKARESDPASYVSASPDECVKFGDPSGTTSFDTCKAHCAQEADGNVAYAVCRVVSIDEMFDACAQLGLAGCGLEVGPRPSALALQVSEAAYKMICDLCESCNGGAFQHTAAEPAEELAIKDALRLLWVSVQSGFVEQVTKVLQAARAPSENGSEPNNTSVRDHISGALTALVACLSLEGVRRRMFAMVATETDHEQYCSPKFSACSALQVMCRLLIAMEGLCDVDLDDEDEGDLFWVAAKGAKESVQDEVLGAATAQLAAEQGTAWKVLSALFNMSSSASSLPEEKLCTEAVMRVVAVILASLMDQVAGTPDERTGLLLDTIYLDPAADITSLWGLWSTAMLDSDGKVVSNSDATTSVTADNETADNELSVDTSNSSNCSGSQSAEHLHPFQAAAICNIVKCLAGCNMDAQDSAPVDHDVAHFFRFSIRQPNATRLATGIVEVLRRFVCLPAAASAPFVATSGNVNAERLSFVVSEGIIQRLLLAMALHTNSGLYVHEVVRFISDVAMAFAKSQNKATYSGKLLMELGITEECLRVLQNVVKRAENRDDNVSRYISQEGDKLIAALSEVYSSISAHGFSAAFTRLIENIEKCPFKPVNGDGVVKYVRRASVGDSSSTVLASTEVVPEEVADILKAAEDLLAICQSIDADAIPVMQPDILSRAAAVVGKVLVDGRLGGILFRALTRVSDNDSNLSSLCQRPFVETTAKFCEQNRADAFAVESGLGFIRPLTLQKSGISLLKTTGMIETICKLAVAHCKSLSPIPMRRTGGKEAGDDDADQLQSITASLLSPSGPVSEAPVAADDAAEVGPPAAPARMEPRIAHYSIQILANVACDQEIDAPSSIPNFEAFKNEIGEGCPGGVAQIVASNGIEVLREIMTSHLDRPRLLQDALCAVSNIAYATDGIRLLIGRTCASMIVQVMGVFNHDPFLFSMALRAVGNLTRCDENIVSVVGQGVIERIVEGMSKNPSDTSALKLAADVIGNLASIDDRGISGPEAAQALREGLQRRAASEVVADASTAASTTAASPTAASPSPTKASQRRKKSVKMARAEVKLQDTLCNWLLDDKAHEGLVRAMKEHPDNAELVSACLRSLQYMAESREAVERMEASAKVASVACLVIRGCDFDAELCVRGCTLLAQLLRHHDSGARQAAVDAGAAQVILSVLETHVDCFDLVTLLLKQMQLLEPQEAFWCTASRELQAPNTLLRLVTSCHKLSQQPPMVATEHTDDGAEMVLRKFAEIGPQDNQFVVRQCLSVLTSWCTDTSIALTACKDVTMAIVALLDPKNAGNCFSDPVMYDCCLNLLATVAKAAPQAAPELVAAGIMQVISPICTQVAHIDQHSIVTHVVGVLQALAQADAQVAMRCLENNAHGVLQCIAIHWALKPDASAAVAQEVYNTCGAALHALLEGTDALRRERASEQRRSEAEARLSAVAGDGSSAPTLTKAALTKLPSMKALLAEDKAFQKEQTRREKEANSLARSVGKRIDLGAHISPAEILETRAGLIPWILFPKSEIEALATSDEVEANVWFLPSMSEPQKHKQRRMTITLSSDLKKLTWSYTSQRHNAVKTWQQSLSAVTKVRTGVQLHLPKGHIFSKSASSARGICLDGENDTVLHLEATSVEEHDVLLRTMSVLCQYARGREGMQESVPLPHIPVVDALATAP